MLRSPEEMMERERKAQEAADRADEREWERFMKFMSHREFFPDFGEEVSWLDEVRIGIGVPVSVDLPWNPASHLGKDSFVPTESDLASYVEWAEQIDEMQRGASLVHSLPGPGMIVQGPASVIRSLTHNGRAVTRTNAQLIDEIAVRSKEWAIRKNLTGAPRHTGTLKHTHARDMLDRHQRMFGNRDLVTESSFLNGFGVPYGTKGSVRVDVLDLKSGQVFDYKFGVTPMTKSQIMRIETHVPNVTTVSPVYAP